MNSEYLIQIKTTSVYNNRGFSGRIFLEKAFLYKYVGNKIEKKDDRKEVYEKNKKLLTL